LDLRKRLATLVELRGLSHDFEVLRQRRGSLRAERREHSLQAVGRARESRWIALIERSAHPAEPLGLSPAEQLHHVRQQLGITLQTAHQGLMVDDSLRLG